jgi:hypothetical protein
MSRLFHALNSCEKKVELVSCLFNDAVGSSVSNDWMTVNESERGV